MSPTIIFPPHTFRTPLTKLVQDIGNVICDRRQRTTCQRRPVGVRHDDITDGMLPYIWCPARIRVDGQPCRVLVIRVRRSSQVGMGPFHDERVAESNGDWEWFQVENGVGGW